MRIQLLLSIGLFFLFSGCGTRDLKVSDEKAYPPHFSQIRDRILRPRCGSCHTKIIQYEEVVGDLVVVGKPEQSNLFKEVDSGGMPKYGGKISDAEIAAIKTWIMNGAEND